MAKLILNKNGEHTLQDYTEAEQTQKQTEATNLEASIQAQAPYVELEKLDAELPRWAEDFANQGNFTLQGRAAEVQTLKEEQRAIIQAQNEGE